MTKVEMNKEQFNIGQNDPVLPREVQEAAKGNMGMTVPQDFFSQFERKMNAVIDAEMKVNEPAIQQPAIPTVPIYKRWQAIAAAIMVVAVIGAAFQLNHNSQEVLDQQGLMAAGNATSADEQELNPMEDIYYTSLSDYEVYDLICGI